MAALESEPQAESPTPACSAAGKGKPILPQPCRPMKRSGGISGTSWGSRRPCTLPLRTLPAPAPRSAKAKVSPSPSQLPALCSRSARSGQAAPGARQSSIYCLVSTVTRRRRQSLPSAAPTRRRDVCPPLPLCPYLERRGGWGRAGSRTPAAPRPLPGSAPARARGALGRTRTPPPTRTLRRRAWGAGVVSIPRALLVEAAVKA